MSGAAQTLSRREALVDWSILRKNDRDHVWLADWKKFGLPYCSIYVIAPEGHWPSKIGISTFAKKRVQSLQTSHWKMLVVKKCYWAETVADARAVEQKVHSILKEDQAYLLGEWFDKSPKQAAEVIEFAAMALGIGIDDKILDERVLSEVSKVARSESETYSAIRLQSDFGSYLHGRAFTVDSSPIYHPRTGRKIK